MAKGNEYIAKEIIEKVEEKTVSEKPKTQKQNTKSTKTSKKSFQLNTNWFNQKKVKNTIGIGLILFSFYFFLACLSYLFTWEMDQDRVMDKTLLNFLFEDNENPVENWLGKFGAWSSHLFIYRWFGLSSFGFSILLFVSGVKILLDYAILPVKKTYAVTLLFMIWGALFLGFFSNQINYLGGSFGFHINQWLILSLGSFGTFALILVLLYLTIVVLFNPNFKAFFNKLFNNEGSSNLVEDEYEEKMTSSMPVNDLHVINTIKDEDIKEEEISAPVVFGEEDEEEEEENDYDFESELEITYKKPEQESNTNLSDDFEISVGEEENLIEEKELLVTETVKEEILSDDEMDDLSKEFGEYDPKLDLASYVLPPIDLLKDYGKGGINIDKQELEENKNRIVETLLNYKIDIAKIKATVGPTVTLYEIVPAPGVRISKIKNLEDDIALSLSALGIRIIAPIPGKGTVGIEVPNSKPEMVPMRALIASEKFQNCDYELPVVLGKTITNETYMFDLTKMPHLLVAGATGQGKSVGLNAILVSILYKKHPAQVKFVLVDPKKVELTLFNKIERHFLAKLPGEGDAIITDTSKVVNTMNSLCIEMDDRYELLKNAQCRTIKEYNVKFIARKLNPENGHRYLPYIVVLIDEFADLIMTAGKEIEHPIARIAQLARAIGIHLIVATQRPSVNVITGMIKANFPARIAFRVLSKIDSRTILDGSGADQLIGKGDMLIMNGSELIRLQCGFVDTPEVEDICNFIGEQRAYPEALILPEYVGEGGESDKDFDTNELDPMFADAARIVVLHQQGSASLLQRKLKLGYNRAGRIVDQLEAFGIIGPFQGSKAREVLYAEIPTLDEFLATKNIF